MIDKPKECNGCYTHDICRSSNTQTEQYEAYIKCPCIKCLIKGVCDRPCEEYGQHRIKYNLCVNIDNYNN